MTRTTLVPVILSGGSGTRLWPASRPQEPKQLLPLVDERTMLQATLDRLDGVDGLGPPLVVCSVAHRQLVASQLDDPAAAMVLEPMGRNTAPAVAAAAMHVTRNGGDPLMLVLPADHVIRDEAALHRAVATAAGHADSGELVTFGIVPGYPETGYGYIHAGTDLGDGVRRVAAFVEKPDLETARRYLASGDYLWNSGMFVFRALRYLEELELYAPAMVAATRDAVDAGEVSGSAVTLDADAFAACPADSIDFAVMERTESAVVVPLDADWNDVGSWSALWDIASRDFQGNAHVGDVVAIDTRDSYLRSDTRLLAAVGIRDLIVVETADAVLVADRNQSQRVKEIVETLRAEGRHETEAHVVRRAAWGTTEVIATGTGFDVNRVEVAAGSTLALRSHPDHAEEWLVLRGTARMVLGDNARDVEQGEVVPLPPDTPYQVHNPGSDALVAIQIRLEGSDSPPGRS